MDGWYAIHTFLVLQHASSFAFVTCHLSCLLCVYLFHAIYLYDPWTKSPWFVSNIFFLQHLFVSIPLVFIRSHFHHGGLVDCQPLCSSQCFLFVVFVTCHALCFLCLFSNLLSGCKEPLPS